MVDNLEMARLSNYLVALGLAPDHAAIYVALSEHGPSTPLQLSRASGINRTKVYRTIEALSQLKMVQVEVGAHSTKVSPALPDRVAQLLKHKQHQVALLAHDFPEMERKLTELGVSRQSDTTVRYYQGKSGIEQMVWNVLKATTEVVGYTYRDLADFVGQKFMDDFAAEFVRRNLTMRDVYGDDYVSSRTREPDWDGHVKSRYLPDTVLAIPHQMDIYDTTVSFYNWHEGEVFGVEIINEKVARLQRQLFELAWKAAKAR